ncbi:MAG: N-acetylneuraminate synthase family protein [Candidatus Staskawiczbacteria bacterium]|nr:N-acetylneuraminate synthase family protein [Candidatus Staskawiczbacteria bacterium]
MKKIKIGNKFIGKDCSTYIIAEAGVNHNGSLERAEELIVRAAKAGADAIKFQTYVADDLVVRGAPKFWNWKGDKDRRTQYEAYEKTGGFPLENYPKLIKICQENNIEFLSTPFSAKSADYLVSIGMKAIKVASSDMSCLPFLEHIAKHNIPIMLSTGASTLEEIKESVGVIKKAGNKKIILLHCTLCYPTELKDSNLNVIKTLEKEFPDLVIGISDHTMGVQSPQIAAAVGAKVIEKHYTTDKTLPDSADHWLSVDPEEMKQLVESVRLTETLLGESKKKIFKCEKETRTYDKRSIVSITNIPKGVTVRREMLDCKRPGTGIYPKYLNKIIGRKTKKAIKKDELIRWKDFL